MILFSRIEAVSILRMNFKDEYWHKKDDLQALRTMYYLLQETGIDLDDESDVFFEEPTGLNVLQKMLEKLSEAEQKKPTHQGEVPGATASVDEIRQNS